MNIFTVLNQGNSRLHEVGMSAVLAYFLDPKADHGLNAIFLSAFLRLTNPATMSNLDVAEASVELEKAIGSGKQARHIDIEIIVPVSGKDNKSHRFIVENKIQPSAAKGTQLSDYYQSYSETARDEGGIENITVVFVTPAGNNAGLTREYNNLELSKGGNKAWVRWQKQESASDGNNNIQSVIREEILKKEAIGEISPINDYVKHTLKAFAMHLSDMGTLPARARMPRENSAAADGSEIFPIAGYEIVKKGNQIFVRKDGQKVVAMHAYKTINKKEGLSISLDNDDGGKRTSYQLGRAIIKELKKRREE